MKRFSRALRTYFLLGSVLVLSGFSVASWADPFLRSHLYQGVPVRFVVEENWGARRIAHALRENGVFEQERLFLLGVWAKGGESTLKAGEYLISSGMHMGEVIDLFLSGRTYQRRLVVVEGATSAEVVLLLENTPALTGQVQERPPEGSLMPDTYYYNYGMSRQSLLDRMGRAQDEFLAAAWRSRDHDTPIKTPEEAIILASIVEKETSVPEERPLVAAVFMNRLRRSMRLQADPTIIYGITNGHGSFGRSLTKQDVRTPSPYNTYVIRGLPPTPIANPGRASLRAVLNPAQSDALFFVTDGKGGHVFAKTYEEHKRNVARWRRAQSKKVP